MFPQPLGADIMLKPDVCWKALMPWFGVVSGFALFMIEFTLPAVPNTGTNIKLRGSAGGSAFSPTDSFEFISIEIDNSLRQSYAKIFH